MSQGLPTVGPAPRRVDVSRLKRVVLRSRLPALYASIPEEDYLAAVDDLMRGDAVRVVEVAA